MIALIGEEYDGELMFDIVSVEENDGFLHMEVAAEYEGETVGFCMSVPTLSRKMLFKSISVLDTAKPMVFSSAGEKSDRLVKVLDQIWKPDFIVSNAFSSEPVEIEYAVLNKEMFDYRTDKVYTRLYCQEDLESGDAFENFNLEIGLNFNADRKRVTIVEMKKEYRNDLLALWMA